MSTKTDNAVEGRTLKGNEAQESIGPRSVETRAEATDLSVEKGLEVERRKAGTSSLGTAKRNNNEEATVAVTRHGYRKGKSFEGYEPRAREKRGGRYVVETRRLEAQLETARTPWPVAGCNKPARQNVE